jgi:U3 small nucleolar RNA-associated protein 5
MVWVQWSLAAHGGYLASQPQLVKQLSTLNKVLKERASGLQPLLSLKGRLDMLHLQLNLRRKNQTKAAQDDEEEAVIYVEGEDDYVSSVEGSIDGDAPTGAQKRLRDDFEDDDDESSVDQMPTTMEVDEESDEGSEDSENFLDDEAEETDVDTGDDMSEPTSDDLEEEGEGVSESEEEAKPARRSTAARAGLKSRR